MSLLDINIMLGPSSADPTNSFSTAEDLLRKLDQLGIQEALVYSSYARWTHPREGNWKLLEQIEGHRDRLHPCWMVLPPATPELPPPEQLVRQMREHGVRAARMLPGHFLFPVSRRVLAPLLEALQGAGFPLIIDLARSHWSELAPWDALFEIAEAYPSLPLILLREGGATIRSLYHLWEAHSNIYLETSYMQTGRALEEICERFGSGRLLLGSGLPQYDAGGPLATLYGSALSDRQRGDIGGNNARRLLGLEVGPPTLDRKWPVGPGGFRVWDMHGHLGPWYKLHYPIYDAAATVRRMDEVGVERIILSDIMAIENDPDAGNERVAAACSQYPGRIYGHAGYGPVHYAGRIQDFERFLDRPGMVGIKLHCQLHDTPPESPLYRPAYELAHKRNLPVLSHGVPAPEELRRLLEEFPAMNYIGAHQGASPPESMRSYIEVANDFPNYFFDLTGSQVFGEALARLVAQMPAAQILFGSDLPMMDFPYQLGRVLYADIPEEMKRQILWDNPARIFRG